MSEPTPIAAIDLHGEFPCRVVTSADGKLRLQIDLKQAEKHTFPNFLHQHLMLEGVVGTPQRAANSIADMQRYQRLEFELPARVGVGDALTLTLNAQPVLRLTHQHGAWVAKEAALTQLAPSEIRALGMSLREDILPRLPYDRTQRQGFDAAQHQPITDLHSHVSAQISAEDLFAIALAASKAGNDTIAYPVELLRLIGGAPTESQLEHGQVVTVAARGFSPLKHEGLACEQEGGKCDAIRLRDLTDNQRERIINQMRVLPDRCILPTQFDRGMYRFRNPFSKHPDLTKAIIKKQAEAYAEMGVKYATLSTSSMLDPAWFQAMEEAVEEIERDGVQTSHGKVPMQMRFLVGVPRKISPEETFVVLNKIKFLARHPYIVGMDVNGYESNKTSDFFWALAHMGRWARDSHAVPEEAPWQFKDNFILQVHAGETGKNQDNVGRAIALAKHYDTRVMVGHALNATLDDNEKRWLKELGSEPSRVKDKFIFQMCPDSNQVFLAKPLVHHSPIKKRMAQAQCVLGSDGGGALGISPRGLAYSAMAAGASLEDLAHMQEYERGFIARQMAREEKNRESFTQHYGEGKAGSAAFLAAYKKHCLQFPHPRDKEAFASFLPKEFAEKTPLFIGGAAGSSWAQLDKLDQWEIEQVMDFLVAAVDPKKVYFVLGRVQNDGVSKSLDVAINRHNKKHPENPFSVLGRVAGTPTGELAETITWLQPIQGDPDISASDMIAFLRRNHGKALLMPGQDYTAEAIIAANDEDAPVASAFMVPRVNKKGDDAGKIYELAQTMPAACQFQSNHQLAPARIGHENAALDVLIDRLLEAGSPLIKDAADRASILREGVDLHAVKNEVLAGWRTRHQTRLRGEPKWRGS